MINTINRAIAKRREEGEGDKGFTLIELLVVVLIIGILAAIAIPAFLSQRQGAWESQVKSDLKNASLAAESYAAANGGTFTSMTIAEAGGKALKDYGYNPTTGVTLELDGVPGTTYGLKATQTNLGTSKVYRYSSVTGKITGPTAT